MTIRAEVKGIETKRLKEAVRRNIERFPSDFMFEMNDESTPERGSRLPVGQENPNLGRYFSNPRHK